MKGSTSMKYKPEVVRNIMVIYGFFFVMLAAMISVSIQTMALNSAIRFLLYIFAWPFALSSSFIGLGIFEMLDDVPDIVNWGFFILAGVVPAGFLLTIGSILLYDFSQAVVMGCYLFDIILLVAGLGYAYRMYRKIKSVKPRSDII
ncbi:MAG: hypothetical protein ACFFER_17800 [Candidatus Thorarchaeota archaeon]